MFEIISSVPKYPENFLLENGKKALIKKLKTLPKNSLEWKKAKNLLKLPVIKTTEQNKIVLPGNGVRLFFLDDEQGLFCVIDGTCMIKEHNFLSEKVKIVLASDKLGKILLGKEINDSGVFDDGNKKRIFLIKNIERPSKAKWPFRY